MEDYKLCKETYHLHKKKKNKKYLAERENNNKQKGEDIPPTPTILTAGRLLNEGNYRTAISRTKYISELNIF